MRRTGRVSGSWCSTYQPIIYVKFIAAKRVFWEVRGKALLPTARFSQAGVAAVRQMRYSVPRNKKKKNEQRLFVSDRDAQWEISVSFWNMNLRGQAEREVVATHRA